MCAGETLRVGLYPVATVLLGSVQRCVGLLDEFAGAALVACCTYRHADAQADPAQWAMRVGQAQGGQYAEDGLAQLAGAGQVAIGGNHRELLTAIAGHVIAGTPCAGLQHAGDGLQALVAGLVAEVVVVQLEVVDIQHQQGQLLATARGPRPFVGEDFIEVAAVTQASQCVGA